VAIIGLEVPQPVFRLWLGPQVRLASRKRKGVSLIGMPKIELTSNDQIAVLIDPQCVVAQRVSVNGSILNCCIACTRERPMCIRYSHRSCMLTVKFWVSVTGTNSVPALHLGWSYVFLCKNVLFCIFQPQELTRGYIYGYGYVSNMFIYISSHTLAKKMEF